MRDTRENDSGGGRLRRAFLASLGFTAVLWAIEVVSLLAGWDLGRYGVFPRRADGLAGVLFAPLIHGSPVHLFFNTGPLLVLGTALLYGYPRASGTVLPTLYLGPGLAVWLLGRPAYHLGASGLCFGMLLFVFTLGAIRWDRRAIALSMIVFFLYGGMLWGVLPLDPGISFESHLAGALLGLGLAVALRHLDAPPPRKTYDWEGEDWDE